MVGCQRGGETIKVGKLKIIKIIMEEMEEWEKDIRGHYLWKRYEGADELIIMIKELIAKKIANLKKSMAKNTRE